MILHLGKRGTPSSPSSSSFCFIGPQFWPNGPLELEFFPVQSGAKFMDLAAVESDGQFFFTERYERLARKKIQK